MTRVFRRLAQGGGLAAIVAAISFFMAQNSSRGPEWSRYWPSSPAGGLPSLTGIDPAGFERPVLSFKTGRTGEERPLESRSTPGEFSTPDFFSGLYGEMRARERRGQKEALRTYAEYLDEISARRINNERLRWEELLSDRARRIAEEYEGRLRAYADKVRHDHYAVLSSLEMQLAMAESKAAAEEIEGELSAAKAEIEARIAQYREDLAHECALQLGVLRAQAHDALNRLEAELKEEDRRALAAFARAEEERYRTWLARNRRAEAELTDLDQADPD